MVLTASGIWRVLNTPIPNPFVLWFRHAFAPIAPSNWPRQWKRALYIGSIIAMTSFTDKPDFVLFKKISNLLEMTYKGESFWIPKFIRNIIWRPILKDQLVLNGHVVEVTNLDEYEINQDDLNEICEYFFKKTPEWIVYAPERFIKNDLKQCLSMLFSKRFDTQF